MIKPSDLIVQNHSGIFLFKSIIFIICLVSIVTTIPLRAQQEELGDVDGNGVVEVEDARLVARFVVGQITNLPKPDNADVNQDGAITIEDALAISQRVTGQTLIVVAGPKYGLPGKATVGSTVRIEVFEHFAPYEVTGGTVQIVSASTGFDSGEQPLTFEQNWRSLYYHWNTGGLSPAPDYEISVSLTGSNLTNNLIQTSTQKSFSNVNKISSFVSLTLAAPIYEIHYLAEERDAFAPAPGIPLVFRRVFPQDHENVPYLGPFGRGWMHNYDIHLEENTDGTISFLTESGFNRLFVSNVDGTYSSAPGDYGTLSRDPDGTFQIREKNGFIFRFQADLKLGYIEDTNGNRITASYNALSQLIEVLHSTNGQSFRFEYNVYGRISKLIDYLDRETIYTFDGTGEHLLNVTDFGGRVTSYTYIQGQGEYSEHRLSSITNPDGTQYFYTFDNDGRTTSEEGYWGTGRMEWSYDEDGTTQITDATGSVLTIRVNEKGIPIEIVDPSGNTTQYSYDSNLNLIDEIDPMGQNYHFEYDRLGNMVKHTDPAGNQITLNYETNLNKLSSLLDSRGNITTFNYDQNGNLVSTIYPDGTSEGFDYDQYGSLNSKTDRNGQMITYNSNNNGLLLSKNYPDGTSANFSHDNAGNMTSASNYTGIITFSYDNLDRLNTVTYPGGRTFQYQYNSSDKRTQMVDPDGRVINYVYDPAGRLFQITDDAGQTIVEYWYDTANRRAGKGLANGIYTTYDYDAFGQIVQQNTYNSSDSLVSYFYYGYDANGNRLSKESVDGIETYSYDALNQLTHVTYPDGSTGEYVYDAIGNRRTVFESGVFENYTVNNLNQYSAVGNVVYSYDDNGNTISKTENGQTTLYNYDYENRLISIHTPTDTNIYTYNPFGLRNSFTSNGDYINFLLDGAAVTLEENNNNQTIARFTRGINLDETIKMERNDSTYFYTQDALLSITDIFNAEGFPIEHYTYKAFGKPLSESNIGNPWYYTGLSYDFISELQYNRFRFYSPNYGRFLNSDPSGFWGGLNLYSYVFNNPLGSIDPFGLALVVPKGSGWGVLQKVQEDIIDWNNSRNPGKTRYWNARESRWEWGPSFDSNDQKYAWDKDGKLWRNPNYLPPNSPYRPENLPTPKRYIPPEDWRSWRNYGNGTCPTFIQLPLNGIAKYAQIDNEELQKSILGEIEVPIYDALIRSDIPIFGVAGGKNFKEYRVEYGVGKNPDNWFLIDSSSIPQNKNDIGIEHIPHMQGDIDIRGNLATWNVGLKNWVHLPWHPPEDTTDLNGIYTIRLVVEGKDGETVEDRVTCEVGRVIAQCLQGIAVSPDKKVTMHFPEQSLTHPFRIYTILPLDEIGEDTLAPPANGTFVDKVYRILEPGDRFAKDVTLEFVFTEEEIAGRKPERIGIVQYDVLNKEWLWLPTEYDISSGGVSFNTILTELPTQKAIYALEYDLGNETRSQKKIETSVLTPALKPINPDVLVYNTFEENSGLWNLRDRYVGAVIERDNQATPDSSFALKITNENYGGNFSVTVLDQSFDVREYPIMGFDYRVPLGIKTDFYLLVNGRWYNLRFTDDPVDYRNQDVNISNLGNFENIYGDDRWHTASIDLYELLRQKTQHTQVDAIVMADWNVGGYMKLDFGRNASNVSYYIDNFKISSMPSETPPEFLIIDDFNSQNMTNLLSAPTGTYSNPGTNYLQTAIIKNESGKRSDHILEIKFDASSKDAYCGYWTALKGIDLRDMKELKFKLLVQSEIPSMLVGLRHAKQVIESRLPVHLYSSPPDQQGWRTVTIPLSAFIGYGLPDLSSLDVLFFTFEEKSYSGKGTVYIDDIQFNLETNYSIIAEFDRNNLDYNLLGGTFRTSSNEAAVIANDLFVDKSDTSLGNQNVIRISYGGSIGLDYGGRTFSYAIWESDLLGFDARDYDDIVIKIRGQKGNEKPNIYLDDGCTRRCIRSKDFKQINTSWQEIRLSLDTFESQGIDLSHLEALQLAFEWEEMSGTIYIDEIYFEKSQIVSEF